MGEHCSVETQHQESVEGWIRLRALEGLRCTDCDVVVDITDNFQPLRSSMIPNGVSDHHTWRSSSITFDIALRKVVYTGIASNADAAITVPQIKEGFVEKDDVLRLCRQAHLQLQMLLIFRERNAKEVLHTVYSAKDADGGLEQIITHMEEYSNVLSTAQVKLYGPSLTCG